MAVLLFQLCSFFREEALPVQAPGYGGWLANWWLGLLIGHLQEEEVGELLQVVAVAHAVVSEDMAVVPDPLDDGGFFGHWVSLI
ncbi:Uncharacterised protein [uncultured archaeon]|nr:Uncharacterised protein [uncultured archaeon]